MSAQKGALSTYLGTWFTTLIHGIGSIQSGPDGIDERRTYRAGRVVDTFTP